MKFQTHLAISIFLALVLLPFVNNLIIFLLVVIITGFIPDIDSSRSYLGHRWYFRPIQWITKHRGMLHSLSFCFFICFVFALFIPVLALPFFLGYGGHLLADSFTDEGITPFWPSKKRLEGNLKTGGMVEDGIFICLCIVNVLLLFWFIY